MSKIREIQVRKCVVTHERLPKSKLLRVVRVDGIAVIDSSGVRGGRGAYIIPDIEIIKKAKKKNSFARALRMKIDGEIYDELIALVDDGNDFCKNE